MFFFSLLLSICALSCFPPLFLSLSYTHTCLTNYFRFRSSDLSIANEAALPRTRPSSCAVRGQAGAGVLRLNRDVMGCERTAASASVSHNAHGDRRGVGGGGGSQTHRGCQRCSPSNMADAPQLWLENNSVCALPCTLGSERAKSNRDAKALAQVRCNYTTILLAI